MVPSYPLLSCVSSVSVKENPDRKKKKKPDRPLGLFSTWATIPPSTVAQSITHTGDVGPWPFKRSELSACWQMHRP